MKLKLMMMSVGLLVLAAIMTPLLPGCATNTGDAGKDARARATNAFLSHAGDVLGRAAVNTLFAVAKAEAQGAGAEWQDAAAAGLWSSVGEIASSETVEAIIDAYSGRNLPATASAAATAFEKSNATPAAKANAIAGVLSTAVDAPPAP